MEFLQLALVSSLISLSVLTKVNYRDKYLRKISFRVGRNWINETFGGALLCSRATAYRLMFIKINFSCWRLKQRKISKSDKFAARNTG